MKHCDTAVIGGGIAGASLAYWLAKAGASVQLIERHHIASGASGRNAGIFLPSSIETACPSKLTEFLTEYGYDIGFRQTGHLSLIDTETIWERVLGEVARQPIDSPRVSKLNRENCERILGTRIDSRFLGGRLVEDAYVLNPQALVFALANAAQREGAVIAENTEVVGLDQVSAHIVRIRTRYAHIHAGRVIVAAGVPSTGILLPSLKGMFAPVATSMISTKPFEAIFRCGMAINWGDVYWRQLETGEIVIGGAPFNILRNDWPGDACKALRTFFSNCFPALAPPKLHRIWVATMDHTKTGRPMIGQFNRCVFLMTGFGGHGLPPALERGKELAEMVLSSTRARSTHAFEYFDMSEPLSDRIH